MRKRKQYIIDRGFQFRTTFAIIGTVTILSALIIGLIAAVVVDNNRKIENIYNIEDSNFGYLTSRPQGIPDPAMRQAMKRITMNHDNNMETLNSVIAHNRILLYILVAFVIGQGLLLYILLIHKTHKIAGPLHVMSQYMTDIIEDRTPTPRKLRRGDELQNFYDLFTDMVKKITSGKGG